MTNDELLQHVYRHFRSTNLWPMVRALQMELGDSVRVRRMAADIGLDVMVCAEGREGKCWLTLEGLTHCPSAEDDVANVLATVRYVAEHAEVEQIDSKELQAALKIQDAALKRLGQILWNVSANWDGGGWAPDGSTFYFRVSEDAVFYRGVKSVADVREVRNRITKDAIETSQLRNASVLPYWEPSEPEEPPQGPAAVLSVRLRFAVQLQPVVENDLAELQVAMAAGAWKAASILAGSCLEAVLLDIWHEHSGEAIRRWGEGWVKDVSAFEMIEAASEMKVVRQQFKPLATFIRQLRNLVHPARAVDSQPATEELAHALVAFLRLLVKEAGRIGDS